MFVRVELDKFGLFSVFSLPQPVIYSRFCHTVGDRCRYLLFTLSLMALGRFFVLKILYCFLDFCAHHTVNVFIVTI